MADEIQRIEGPIELDGNDRAADWPKRTWDFPNGVPERVQRRNGRVRPSFPELADGESATAPPSGSRP